MPKAEAAARLRLHQTEYNMCGKVSGGDNLSKNVKTDIISYCFIATFRFRTNRNDMAMPCQRPDCFTSFAMTR